MNDLAALNEIIQNLISDNNSLKIALIVLISINIVVEVVRFVGMIILSNKDKSNKRQLLIEEKRIKVLEQLFQSLDELTLFSRGDEEKLLERLKEINLYIAKNKLYIPKSFQSVSSDILDYFTNVLIDFRLKSIEAEVKLFEKYCNEFSK